MKRAVSAALLLCLTVAAVWGIQSPAFDAMLARRLPGLAWRAGFRLALEGLDLDLLRATVRVDGLRVAPAAAPWVASVRSATLRFHPLASLSGTPHFSLGVVEPRFAGSIKGDREGEFELPDVVFDTVSVERGSLRIAMPDYDLAVEVPDVRIQWRHGRGYGVARGGGLRWAGAEEAFGEASFEGSRRLGVLNLDRFGLSTRRVQLSGAGRMGLKHLLDARVEGRVALRELPEAWTDAAGLGSYRPIEGELRVGGRVGGRFESPIFDGRMVLSGGRIGPLPFSGASAQLKADVRGLSFRELEARSGAGVARGLEGRLGWGSGLSLEARGKAVDFDLRPFMALFADGHFPVGLRVTGDFAAKGKVAPELALECRVDASVRGLDVTTVGDSGPVTRFALPEGRVAAECTVGADALVFRRTRVDGGSAVVDIRSGRIDYTRGLELDTELRLSNLSLVRQYLPEGTEARGRAVGRFAGPYEKLKFRYDVSLDEVSLWGSPLGAFAGRAEYDLTDLSLARASLVGPLGRLAAEGRVRLLPGGALDLSLDWSEGDAAALRGLLSKVSDSVPEDLSGTCSAKGRLGGTLSDPRFEGAVALVAARAKGYRLDEGRAEGVFGRSQWRLEQLAARAYGAELDASGAGEGEYFELSGGLRNLDAGGVGEALGRQLPASGTFGGSFRAWGPYRSPFATLAGRATALEVRGRPLGDVEVTASLQGAALLARLSAFDGRAVATAVASLEGEGAFNVELQARELPWEPLVRGVVPEGLAAAGLFGHGGVSGRLRPEVRVAAASWEGTVSGLRYRDFQAGPVEVTAAYGEEGLRFSATAWGGEALVKGEWPLRERAPLGLSLRLADLDLARFAEVAEIPRGRITAAGGASLDLEALGRLEGRRRLEAVTGLNLSGRVAGLIVPGWVTAPAFDFRLDGEAGLPRLSVSGKGLRASGAVTDAASLAWVASAELEGLAPAEFFPVGHSLGGVEGTLTGVAKARGTGAVVEEASSEGNARGLGWKFLGPTEWTWAATLAGRSAWFRLTEPRGLTAEGTWDGSLGLRASVVLAEVTLKGWAREGLVPQDLEGELSGRGDLAWGAEAGWSGKLRLSRLAAALPPFKMENVGDLALSYGAGVLRFDAVRLGGKGLELTLEGELTPGREWALRAQGRGDLGILSRGVPGVRRSAGAVEAEVSVTGAWASPVVEGPVEILPGASLVFEGFDLPLEDLDGKGYLEGGRGLVVEWLDGQAGEGRFHVEGFLGTEGLKPRDLRFLVEVRDVTLENPPQVTYRFDSDVLVTGTVTRPEVRGEVRLDQLLYAQRLNWKSMVLGALRRRPREVQGAAGERVVFVDLALRGAQGLRVENNLAELDLALDLRARGFLPQPVLWGRAEVVAGEVRFRSQQYDVLRSAVEFLGEARPVPLLDLHARTAARQYLVNVDVSGPLDAYQVTLSSVPPLPQTDLVALLTLGTTSEQVLGTEAVSAAEAASLLTGSIQDLLETGVGEALGIDQFVIDTAYDPTTHASMPRVTVGKSVTQALFARYSMAVGDEAIQNMEVQYTLSPHLQLLGTWADTGATDDSSLGGEVRFRFTFR